MASKEKTQTHEKDYFDFLQDRLLELIALPIPADKYNSVENLIYRYTAELKDSVSKGKTDAEVNLEFKHYVKNILSIIETLISGEQYKALRRLLQNEIYSCATVFLSKREQSAKD
jgi:hypothetical protein